MRAIHPAARLTGALLLLAGLAHADTVTLKDGRVLRGRVIERGDRLFVEQELGGITVSRQDVVRVESDEAPPAAALRQDLLVLKDGRVIRGDIRISDDGSEVVVSLGRRGEARHPRRAVSIIRWRDGKEEIPAGEVGATNELHATLSRRVVELSSSDAAVAREARRELLALGPFARTYLDDLARAKPTPALASILTDLDRLEAYRKVVPARAEAAIPRLAERLVSRDPSERESALKSVAMEAPDDCGPVLLHAVEHDPAERVRAYCISQLASLRRFEELAEVLKVTDGPLRLAAAFALGDAGVYAGVPVLIDALRLEGADAAFVREAAANKLRQWTGQFFGYRHQASSEERAKAADRWQGWWDENGQELIRHSLKQVAPDLAGARTTEEERDRAKGLWQRANRLIAQALASPAADEAAPAAGGAPTADDVDGRAAAEAAVRRQALEEAVRLLRQALELDPALSDARMTLANLLYAELGRPNEAERELNLIVVRADHDAGDADAAKKYANHHLGHIALAEGSWRRATVRFTQAINYDEGFIEAHEGLGDAYLGMALNWTDGQAGPGASSLQEALEKALDAYTNALQAMRRHEEALKRIVRDLVNDSPDDVREGQAMQAVRRSMRNLDERRAGVHARVGQVNAALHRYEHALAAYREALRLQPEEPRYREAVRVWAATVDEQKRSGE